MTDTKIARRYASAVFKLGMQEGGNVVAQRGKTLKDLDSLLDQNAALNNVFKSPIFSVDEKKKVLSDVLTKIGSDTVTRNFCFLLA
ncbi:MAG: F0F1 ATP synthase subunit delta, partial [Desulfovibrionaceae bacterium]|nr:F0F1 ATP synthase subunit delta [Desulfovibrionaceae bacterium]